jgi:hypothetical protein
MSGTEMAWISVNDQELVGFFGEVREKLDAAVIAVIEEVTAQGPG